MRFREASAWASAIIVAAIFGAFFAAALDHPAATIPLLIKASLGVIVWEVAIHIAFAVRKAPEPVDEEDRHIGRTARRIGLMTLSAGLFLTLGQFAIPHFANIVHLPAHAWLIDLVAFAIVAAEITKSLTAGVLYRLNAGRPARS